MRFRGRNLSLPQKQTYHPSPNYVLWNVKELTKGE